MKWCSGYLKNVVITFPCFTFYNFQSPWSWLTKKVRKNLALGHWNYRAQNSVTGSYRKFSMTSNFVPHRGHLDISRNVFIVTPWSAADLGRLWSRSNFCQAFLSLLLSQSFTLAFFVLCLLVPILAKNSAFRENPHSQHLMSDQIPHTTIDV